MRVALRHPVTSSHAGLWVEAQLNALLNRDIIRYFTEVTYSVLRISDVGSPEPLIC